MSSVLLRRLMSSVVRCEGGYAPSQMKTTANAQLFLPRLPCSRIESCQNSGLLSVAHVRTQPEPPLWSMSEAEKKTPRPHQENKD